MAAVGSGCGATFFVWVQHHGVVRTLRTSQNTALVEEHLADFCAGRSLAGTAFAHVRRSGPTGDHGDEDRRGLELDGTPRGRRRGVSPTGSRLLPSPTTASWCGHCSPADRRRACRRRRSNSRSSAPLPPSHCASTAASCPTNGSSRRVGRGRGAAPIDATHRSANQRCSAWPIGRNACSPTSTTTWPSPQPKASAAELRSRWQIDDDLMRSLGRGDEVVTDASNHRAACLDLARRSTTALLAAVGGRGMDLSHPAQRLAREADFYVIQAQTADGRAATLRSVAHRRSRRTDPVSASAITVTGQAVVAVVVAAVLFGTSGTARELGPDSASSLSVGAARITIGSMVLWIVVLANRRRDPLPSSAALRSIRVAPRDRWSWRRRLHAPVLRGRRPRRRGGRDGGRHRQRTVLRCWTRLGVPPGASHRHLAARHGRHGVRRDGADRRRRLWRRRTSICSASRQHSRQASDTPPIR